MRKCLTLFVSLIALTLIIPGCSDDDDDKINPPTASVKNVTANINGITDLVDSVFLTIDPIGREILAKTEFKNNQFAFTFPETLESDYLSPIITDDLFKDFTISDKSAMICFSEFYAYKGHKAVGYFSYTDGANFGTKNSYYIYVDRDVTITGKNETSSHTFIIINCAFIKGWNLVTTYGNSSETEHSETWETATYTNLKWVYNKFE